MTLYRDYPLEASDSIRLLTLHPGHGDATIEVHVMTVRLSAKPDFIALSYTWGSPVDERHPSYRDYDLVDYHISCAGELLAVNQNLHEALWQLRQKQECLPLWIDAVCIDQKNKEEINDQLLLMRRIYCVAQCVIIWLGRDDATTQEAVQWLKDFGRGEDLTVREGDTQFPDSMSRERGQGLTPLFRRRWFNRVWTLQEVLLPQKTKCLCGPYELDIGDICMFAALSLRTASNGRFSSSDELLNRHLRGAACISAWHGMTLPAGGFGSRAFLRYPKMDREMEVSRSLKWLVALELLVHESRQRDCSKLEDKILAPLAFALLEDFAPKTSDYFLLQKEASRIADCQIPVPELYRKFTRFMIESMSNLDILSRAHRHVVRGNRTEKLNLPSWVPPFQEAGTTSLIDDILFTKFNASIHLGPYRKVESSK
ncbi:hypothetical protein QQZ08_011278 [Neonectria magnoliae]|uniref:Heterokaryon incompatibility domain-containing protein n=1 Tax=Neonectria magnoliae TaxID=2732573 RepID=A0ABR1HB58_9HYPO